MCSPTEDQCDDIKYSFYEEVEAAFDQFPELHMVKILLDFNVKVRREDIFKQLGMRVYMKLVMIMGL
jgi:hypothetical protein